VQTLGWVVEYLADVRNGKLSEVGYIPSGLWGGICLGRLLLSEPAHRLGPRRMIAFYIFLILAFQLVFWLVPNIIASAVALSFLGFFFGPLFPIVSEHILNYFAPNRTVLMIFEIGNFGWHKAYSESKPSFGAR